MDFFDWINKEIIGNGLLCEEYAELVCKARSRKELFEICCDTNGLKFIPEMAEKGHPLPYKVILDEFKSFINGKYTARIKKGFMKSSYTSQIYCGYTENIVAETTGLCLLNCKCDVMVPANRFVYIVVDSQSKIRIIRNMNCEVKVIPYGNAQVEIITE